MTQCGCSATENCAYDGDLGGTACGAIGTTEPYHACDANTDCPRGHGCIGGACKKHCTSADDCGWDEASCEGVYDGEMVIEGFGFCSEECNPIHPTVPREGGVACDDNATCYAYTDDDGNLEHTLCAATPGEGVQGDPCADANGDPDPYACAPGYRCSSSSKTCRRWCEVGGDDCAEEDSCVGFDPRAYLDDYELGSCFSCETGDFECSVYPECGCDTGDACKITDLETGATECLVAGSVPAWGSCSAQEDCAPAAGACVSSVCHPYCEEPGGDSCAVGDCLQAVATATQTPVPGLYYCGLACEPVLAAQGSATNVEPCGEDAVCIPVHGDPVDVASSAFCATSAGVSEGGYCDSNDDCANGTGCLDNQCTLYCRSSADCSFAFPTCFTFLDPLYAGPGDEVGQCFIDEG